MYKDLTAEDFKKHFNLPPSYSIDGFLVYGGFGQEYYKVFKAQLKKADKNASYKSLTHEFLKPILEIQTGGKKYWFAVAYGGAMLSEWVHLASIFGSKKNILIGYCGGLVEGARSGDIVVPTHSFGDESSTRIYNNSGHKHQPDSKLRQKLIKKLENKHKIWEGPTTTCQAMLGETLEDITEWAREGYYGVDMETSTLLAVSNHFNIPTASALIIGDNLIYEETVLDESYEAESGKRQEVKNDLFDVVIEELIT